jgi:hypothetical protein
MARRNRIRLAAWGALLAMALHALSPLAAPAPRDRAPGLHDICTSAPAAPQPAGDPSTSHCALCVQPAAISCSPAILDSAGPGFEVRSFHAASAAVRPLLAPSSRAPPAGA